MNDKTLVEQQFAALKKAHKDVVEKYCDLVLEKNRKTDTIEAQATRIEALEAALRNIQALAKKRQAEGGPDGNLKAIEGFAKQALESQP